MRPSWLAAVASTMASVGQRSVWAQTAANASSARASISALNTPIWLVSRSLAGLVAAFAMASRASGSLPLSCSSRARPACARANSGSAAIAVSNAPPAPG